MRKRVEPERVREQDVIVPAALPLELDPELFLAHLSQLQQLTEPEGGIETCLERLNAKHRRFAEVLAPEAAPLDLKRIEELLGRVFPARRRIYPLLQALGQEQTAAAVKAVLMGEEAMDERMRAFAEAMPVAPGEDRESRRLAARQRRAAMDFAAELLHFRDPVKYPLMTRWVWDKSTMSGALRELVRGADELRELPFDMSPETFEGVRKWLAEQIAGQGIYREVPFWIDLLLGEAYVGYVRSVAEGNLGGDFGRGVSPLEQLQKLLGIDEPLQGRSRVRKGNGKGE